MASRHSVGEISGATAYVQLINNIDYAISNSYNIITIQIIHFLTGLRQKHTAPLQYIYT